MTRQKMVARCQWLIRHIKEAEDGSGLLSRIGCGPSRVFSMWPDGMPRGTNEPEAALLQRSDVNLAIDRLDEWCEELEQLLSQLEMDNVA